MTPGKFLDDPNNFLESSIIIDEKLHLIIKTPKQIFKEIDE